jgi:hypothetical protein
MKYHDAYELLVVYILIHSIKVGDRPAINQMNKQTLWAAAAESQGHLLSCKSAQSDTVQR